VACSLLARVGVARFGLKAKLPWMCCSLVDLPTRLSELAAILRTVSSHSYQRAKRAGRETELAGCGGLRCSSSRVAVTGSESRTTAWCHPVLSGCFPLTAYWDEGPSEPMAKEVSLMNHDWHWAGKRDLDSICRAERGSMQPAPLSVLRQHRSGLLRSHGQDEQTLLSASALV